MTTEPPTTPTPRRHCLQFSVRTVMTAASHQSGTDRIAEAVLAERAAQIVVNVQGDEPLIPPAMNSKSARVSWNLPCQHIAPRNAAVSTSREIVSLFGRFI